MTPEQLIEELCGLMAVKDGDEALAQVRVLRDRNMQLARPLVWIDAGGALYVAQLTVKQVNQVVTALEGLQVSKKGE